MVSTRIETRKTLRPWLVALATVLLVGVLAVGRTVTAPSEPDVAVGTHPAVPAVCAPCMAREGIGPYAVVQHVPVCLPCIARSVQLRWHHEG